ncbi:flavin reductase family protein [Roseateles chitinivorans]|uniref:flavin reductase family protein n=1 Tax=Roseateles chitinivorans TaxID=2917965 RepID=UPI003D673690
MNPHVAPVPLNKAYRLLNHGPTVLVSASHGGVRNAMAAAWSCALDFQPPKVTVVLDKATRTRELVEASGFFVLQVPTAAQAVLTHRLGNRSLHQDPEKLSHAGAKLVDIDLPADAGTMAEAGPDAGPDVGPGDAIARAVPLVDGCAAWLVCRVLPEPRNQWIYDLFIGEVVAAWADARVFSDGHWHFESAPPELRTLHYIAGGQFYAIGESIVVPDTPAAG